MAKISINNGASTHSPEEAIQIMGWDVISQYMDDTTRETVHILMAPCTELEFLEAYLSVAEEDLIIG
jgi:hypothetical protein